MFHGSTCLRMHGSSQVLQSMMAVSVIQATTVVRADRTLISVDRLPPALTVEGRRIASYHVSVCLLAFRVNDHQRSRLPGDCGVEISSAAVFGETKVNHLQVDQEASNC